MDAYSIEMLLNSARAPAPSLFSLLRCSTLTSKYLIRFSLSLFYFYNRVGGSIVVVVVVVVVVLYSLV
jgi:hypothetical protein